jgi:hypothetical protein
MAGIRHVSMIMLAFAMMAAIQHQANKPTPKNRLIRWSIQEIRRIAHRLAQRRIDPADIIAWSLWRHAHRAVSIEMHCIAGIGS